GLRALAAAALDDDLQHLPASSDAGAKGPFSGRATPVTLRKIKPAAIWRRSNRPGRPRQPPVTPTLSPEGRGSAMATVETGRRPVQVTARIHAVPTVRNTARKNTVTNKPSR